MKFKKKYMVEAADGMTQLIGFNTNPVLASALLATISGFWRTPDEIEQMLPFVENSRERAYGVLEE